MQTPGEGGPCFASAQQQRQNFSDVQRCEKYSPPFHIVQRAVVASAM